MAFRSFANRLPVFFDEPILRSQIVYLSEQVDGDVNAAVGALSSGDTLFVDVPATLTNDLVVPDDVYLVFLEACILTLGAFDLTLNGPFKAPNSQIFNAAGAGAVSVAIDAVNVRWWGAVGDGVADDTSAFQQALDTGRDVFIPEASKHRISTLSMATARQVLYGMSTLAEIQHIGAGICIEVSANETCIRHVRFTGNAGGATIGVKYTAGMRRSIIEKCRMADFDIFVQDLGYDNTIRDTYFEDYGTTGIENASGESWHVSECRFYVTPGSVAPGMAHAKFGGDNVAFNGCVFDSGYRGVEFTSNASVGVFNDCHFENLSSFEIYALTQNCITLNGGVCDGAFRCGGAYPDGPHWTLNGVLGASPSITDDALARWVFNGVRGFDETAFSGGTPGQHVWSSSVRGCVRGVYDFANQGGAQGNFVLGELPDNSYITRAWYDMVTAFTSGGASKVNFGIVGDDITGLKGVTNFDDASYAVGAHDFTPDGTAANFTTKTTTVRDIVMVVGTADLTAGHVVIWCEYVVSE